uniref:Mitochondrial carrier 1 n=1 Tax=Zosterops lateralis melanops TaxID=1220523 RepID=A0A8D2P0Y5_ZOSLA
FPPVLRHCGSASPSVLTVFLPSPLRLFHWKTWNTCLTRMMAWAMQEEQHSFSHSCFLLPPQTSHEMMMQCVSRVVSHPLHVISMRCMVQFVGREVKYRVIQEVALGLSCTSHPSFCPCSGLVPHILGDVIFLWCCNLLAHFINTYAVDDNVSEVPEGGFGFSQASVIRSYTKFVMGIAVSMLTYPFLLVGDLMAVNNCGLRAGLPPYAPVFASWIHCWRYLSAQVMPGDSLLPRPFWREHFCLAGSSTWARSTWHLYLRFEGT